jgi:hypothetical protein
MPRKIEGLGKRFAEQLPSRRHEQYLIQAIDLSQAIGLIAGEHDPIPDAAYEAPVGSRPNRSNHTEFFGLQLVGRLLQSL